MKRRISRTKAAVAVLAPTAASIAVVGLGAQAAHADTSTDSTFTYNDRNGTSHTCTIHSALFDSDNSLAVQTDTADYSADPDCRNSEAFARADFNQKSDGTRTDSFASGSGGRVQLNVNNVDNGKNVTTLQNVYFISCSCQSPDVNLTNGK